MYLRAWECLRSVVDKYNTTKRNDFPCIYAVVRTWYIFSLFKSPNPSLYHHQKKKANKTNIYVYNKSVNLQQPVDWWPLLTVQQYDNPIDLFTMGDLFVTMPVGTASHPPTVLCLKSSAPEFWICLGDKIFSSDMVKEDRFLDKRKKQLHTASYLNIYPIHIYMFAL